MSTKGYQQGVTKRIRALIDEAGGVTAFARQVWGDAYLSHKGKVAKWKKGDSGIRPDEAKDVAEKFGRRPAWLLLGDLPERKGITRPEADLAQDLAAYIANEIGPRVRNERLWRYFVTYWQIDGRAALRLAVDKEVERFRKAIGGLEEFEKRAREALEAKSDYFGDITGAPPVSKKKGESQPVFRERQRRREKVVSALVWELVNTARLAEFASQLGQPEPTALVFVPPGKKGPHHGEQRQRPN